MMIHKSNRFIHLLIITIQIILGIYSCSINNVYIQDSSFEQLFVHAKNGSSFEFISDDFTIGIVLNLLNVIVAIIMIILAVNKDYKSKCYYFAVRYASFDKFFFKEFLYAFVLCVLNEFAFDFGILTNILLKYKIYDFSISKTIMLMIFNSLIVIIVLSVTGVFLSFLSTDKMSVLILMTVFVVFFILLFYLPVGLKQFDIISWYYIDQFITNQKVFTYNKFVYYLMNCIILLLEYFASKKLSRKDIL